VKNKRTCGLQSVTNRSIIQRVRPSLAASEAKESVITDSTRASAFRPPPPAAPEIASHIHCPAGGAVAYSIWIPYPRNITLSSVPSVIPSVPTSCAHLHPHHPRTHRAEPLPVIFRIRYMSFVISTL
jgi:hypothetical protein